ncbi:RDD family protein [Cytophagaceae bacterium DM2B3-1]|uniref:RDD family protein n=1 Tax=Xanthocytophaga flava TaxID=3048013 RepID=A0AAE3UAP2_9BACT|nr:RDD family protein [Xanthocytophaga flavus]MDJ1467076.1 RDD family protein [Xanthocytophaga flavus]MDJ1484922.1 RDD family protein [Xanthocytophaga flavus]MDJ1497428.1 RDD family protein [Xanthocytophaga flavus]
MQTREIAIEYPSLLKRIQSSVIDALVVILFMVIFTQIADSFENFPVWLRVVFMFTIVLYEPVCITYFNTLGQYLLGIRVRDNDYPSERIPLFKSIIRFALKTFLGWFAFISVYNNKRRRALHDMAAGSIVVSRKSTQ